MAPSPHSVDVEVKDDLWFYARLGNSTRRRNSREVVDYVEQHWRLEGIERRARPWDGEMCFPVHYVPGSAGAGDARRLLIRAFKNGELGALETARSLLRSTLLDREDRLTRSAAPRLLVPLPGHLAGPAGRPLDGLCRELATDIPWLIYRPGLLVRARTIRQSSASDLRPSLDEHLNSLCWRGGRINRSVIMVDDVYTHGHLSSACRQLVAYAGSKDIALACLGLTLT